MRGTLIHGKEMEKNIFFVHVLSDNATAMHCIPLLPVPNSVRQTDSQSVSERTGKAATSHKEVLK